MKSNPLFNSIEQGANPANIDSDITGRVEHVVLTNEAYRYKSVEIPAGSLSCILFSIVGNMPDKIDSSNFFLAYPKSNIKRLPIVNELVEVIVDASKDAQTPKGVILSNYYYGDPLPLYNAVNHNANPSYAKYIDLALQSPTGKDFKEKSGLYPLQPLPGCTIIEGRFGNSLRLGSSNSAVEQTPWKGTAGDPVTVLRNGQKVQTVNNVTSVFEDLDGDGSVLAMFSTQTVQFVPACTNFKSYDQTVDTTQRANYITTTPVTQTPVQDTTTVQQDVIQAIPVVDTPPVVYETNVVANETAIAEKELENLPDSESEAVQIFEDEVIRVNIDIPRSEPPPVAIKTVSSPSYVKNAYPNVKVVDAAFTKIKKDAVRAYINSTAYSDEIKSSAYTIFRIESGNGDKGVNNNFSGVQADGGKLGTPWDTKVAATCLAKENSTGKWRRFVVWDRWQTGFDYLLNRVANRGVYVGGFAKPYTNAKVSDAAYLSRAYIKEWVTGSPNKEPSASQASEFLSIYRDAYKYFSTT